MLENGAKPSPYVIACQLPTTKLLCLIKSLSLISNIKNCLKWTFCRLGMKNCFFFSFNLISCFCSVLFSSHRVRVRQQQQASRVKVETFRVQIKIRICKFKIYCPSKKSRNVRNGFIDIDNVNNNYNTTDNTYT